MDGDNPTSLIRQDSDVGMFGHPATMRDSERILNSRSSPSAHSLPVSIGMSKKNEPDFAFLRNHPEERAEMRRKFSEDKEARQQHEAFLKKARKDKRLNFFLIPLSVIGLFVTVALRWGWEIGLLAAGVMSALLFLGRMLVRWAVERIGTRAAEAKLRKEGRIR